MIKDLTASDGIEFSERRITPEGFLEAPANIARSGVQLYRARELGLDKHGIPGDQMVRLHRPDEELFNPNVMSAFDGKPVINGTHTTITADNWKEHAVGDIATPERNGNLLRVAKMTLRDKSAVEDVNSGKKFLSIGYKFDADLTPGTTATGDAYDGVQRNIRPNHVLITSIPRGGPSCAIADSAEQLTEVGERKMKIIIDSIPVEVGDSSAEIVNTLIKQRDDARSAQPSVKYNGQTLTGGDAITAELKKRDEEITQLKAKAPTDAQIEERVRVRALIMGDSAKLVKDFDCNGKDNVTIQRECIEKIVAGDTKSKTFVETMLAGVKVGDASPETLNMVFRSLVASTVVKRDTTGADSAIAAALTGKGGNARVNDKPSGRDAFIANQNKAWQK